MQNQSSSIVWLLVIGILIATANTLLERRGHRSLFSLSDNVSAYRRRDDFVSRAEAGFYHQLCREANGWAVVFAKVNLGDLLYASGGTASSRARLWNQINRKHVDFVLCDLQTVEPLVAVELDDSSHARAKRIARDRLVEDACRQASLPLARVPLKSGYRDGELQSLLRAAMNSLNQEEATLQQAAPAQGAWQTNDSIAPALQQSVPLCPKCGAPMRLRVAQRGGRAGSEFWGCSDYPRCRGTRSV